MENASPLARDTASTGWIPGKVIRKANRKKKRYENQIDRARTRDILQAGLRDPDFFLDLAKERKNTKRLETSGHAQRSWLLQVQKRKVLSELRNTRDLDTFIEKTSRSRTLNALIAMGFFRHVLNSEEYREDHRYRLAILKAMEEPGLSKAIQRKWENFDKEFPSRSQNLIW